MRLFVMFLVLLVITGCDFSWKPSVERPVDWTAVTAMAPNSVPGLKVWLAADSLAALSDGDRVSKWTDSSGQGNAVSQADATKMPRFRAKVVNGKPALSFSAKRSFLEKAAVPATNLISDGSTSAFLVLRQNGSRAENDALGWGNCVDKRYVAHLAFQGNLYFQIGAPSDGVVVSPKPLGWDDQFHLIAIVKDGSSGRMDVDGVRMGKGKMKGELDAKELATFVVGNSPCNNGFEGEIAEVLVYNVALKDAQRQGVALSLAKKYGIVLR